MSDYRELAFRAPLLIGALGLAFTTAAQVLTHRKLRAHRVGGSEPSLPAISVLKPLKGLDEGLYENLASIARQDFPEFEIVFGVEDPADPALAIALQVRRDFPHVPMRIVARPGRGALNPKISNLLNMLEVAQHDCLLISDSNVRVDLSYLRSIATELSEPGVGLVSNLIVGRGEKTAGALLENLQLNSFVIAGVCLGDALGHPIVVGKSMLLRRSQLEALGGLRSMADVMAEDYLLGQLYHSAGLRVVLSAHPVYTHNNTWSLARFIARHTRWAQMRRWGGLPTFIAELLMYPVPWLLAALWLAWAGDVRPAMACALAGIAWKVLSDAALVWGVRNERPPARVLALIPLRDCLLLALWCSALVRRTVVWRGNRRRIGHGTRLVAAPAHGELAQANANA